MASHLLVLALALATTLASCSYQAPVLETVTPGPLLVGASEDYLSLPVGVPLGGYTTRLFAGHVDSRDSAYADKFSPSAGVQTRIPVKAFWFDNGQENLVLIKIDLIYSIDALVGELETTLSSATGLDLEGRVVVATSHTHNAYGNFNPQPTWYLGGDSYNHEVFVRMTSATTSVALAAYEAREEASVGLGMETDWDPNDDVYRDRRGENDDLAVFDDIPAGPWKDPLLWMMRIDTLVGDPMAVLYGFGIHGIVLDVDNAMISVDAPGHTELAFQESFDSPVVVALFQAGAGDASPTGEDDGYARLESVGENAAGPLLDLWQSIVAEPVEARLETQTRSVMQTRDEIRVSRNGEVDWTYLPWADDYEPDLKVYEDDGSVASPVDEFTARYGAAFCGDESPYLSSYSMEVDVYPYESCTLVDGVAEFLASGFDLDSSQVSLPLLESQRTMLTASRMGPFPTLLTDGSHDELDFLLAFFPGEPCAYYA